MPISKVPIHANFLFYNYKKMVAAKNKSAGGSYM
jgi:hypothetical protein